VSLWEGLATPPEVTVALPTIPPRRGLLKRAVGSVLGQTYPASALSIVSDLWGNGAAWTRNEALQAVRTPWVAFLDDDDQFLPNHLETLMGEALRSGADYVYSWFLDEDHPDPLGHFGKPFDPANPTQTTITTLVRTDLAKSVGFCEPPIGATVGGLRYGEDYQFTVGCVAYGAKVVHVPARTWIWNWHGKNTSGRSWTAR
jgi:glycosyltransferase involved in cell wall biosynthesis